MAALELSSAEQPIELEPVRFFSPASPDFSRRHARVERIFWTTQACRSHTQYPVEEWHQLIGDATIADAILDRLVHNAYRIDLKGKSMREERAQRTVA